MFRCHTYIPQKSLTNRSLLSVSFIDAPGREIFLPAQEKIFLCPGKNIFLSRERFRLFLPSSQ
jgi:hypothetical protein